MPHGRLLSADWPWARCISLRSDTRGKRTSLGHALSHALVRPWSFVASPESGHTNTPPSRIVTDATTRRPLEVTVGVYHSRSSVSFPAALPPLGSLPIVCLLHSPALHPPALPRPTHSTMAAFIPGGVTAAAVGGRRRPALCTSRGATAARTRVETRCLVVDVGSAEQLQVVLDSASEAKALVVIDYSTTWCGPCKVRVARLILVASRV